jgi:NitT/TauT family transport system permease protein
MDTSLVDHREGPRPARSRIWKDLATDYPHLFISPLVLVGLLILWWSATSVFGVPTYVLPPPGDVLSALLRGLSRGPTDVGGYWYHTAVTVWEALLGFCIGSLLGAGIGIALCHWALLGKVAYPYVVAFQSLPKVALAPLMVVWFGFGIEGKVLITAVIAFFPVLVNVMAGYKAVEPERIELAKSCRATPRQILQKIIIPSLLPYLFAGLSTASVLAVLGAIVGEFVGASAGLGMLLMQYNQALEIAPLFAVILILGIVGCIMNAAVGFLDAYFCSWAKHVAR